jgi:HK97 family phage prohead protease
MDITTKTSGKYIAEIKSTTATTKAPNGSFEAVLSVPSVDRDREVLDAGAFNPLPEHITIDIDHAMTVEKTVASGSPYYDGAILKFEGTYASHPLAQMVRSLVEEGHIRTMSVAYMNSHYEVDDTDGLVHLRKAELLNAGIVGIPSNREALITASKSLVSDVADAITDAETKTGARQLAALQSIHDTLVKLGVTCETKSVTTVNETPTETNPEETAAAAKAAAAVTPVAVDVAALRALELEAQAVLL